MLSERIELSTSACKTEVFPLNYESVLEYHTGFEPVFLAWQASVLDQTRRMIHKWWRRGELNSHDWLAKPA